MAASYNPRKGAFDSLIKAPPAPASTSAEYLPYDVFINHHGEDVKHTLATTIYNSLDATGLRVFLDKDELKLGDFFPQALEEAMGSASFHIAIFSEKYAESPWCLDELAFMLQTGIKFIPVFYHVEPSTLRWAIAGKGIYADVLSKHEIKNRVDISRYSSEQLQRWKEALHKASFYTGETINNQGDQEKVVTNVVNRVLKELKKVQLDVAKHPVGLDEAVQDFEEFALQSVGPIQIVGICGMGGAGKTTLAKEFYNKKCSTIHRSSFIFDLRESAKKGLLHKKQKKLLEDLDLDLKGKGADFDNVDTGKEILKSRLRSVSVLIVLDDVDHIDQLDALLPTMESLGHGSLIIVTTRELQVLKAWDISAIYKIRKLNAAHAKELFCWHAFRQPSPLSGFEDLSEKFINACHGLPLSLKVLGGQLYREFCKNYWQSQLDKLCRIVPDDIKLRLKISYDALDKEEKEMFLDIACFFIGHESSQAIAVWDGSGWNGLHGWQRLVNKCLVELEWNELREKNLIRMHDHLRDLGREIANQQSPYRLWSPRQIIEIQPQQEAIPIRGMVEAIGNNCYSGQGKIIIHTNQGERSLAPCSLGLKIFVGDEDFIDQEHSELSRELLWLQCSKFEHKNLPSWLSLKKLRILALFHPRRLEDLWERDADAPLQLSELIIPGHSSLRGFPRSIAHLRNLKKILIGQKYTDNNTLSGLPQEFCHLQSLEHLDMQRCKNLLSLPSNFGDLTNLRHLNFKGCTALKLLPDSFKKLTLLEYLNLGECAELTIKSKLHLLENMTKLGYLNLDGCRKLEELRLPEVASLTKLYLDGTGLKELPANISQLTMLTELTTGSKFLTTLPTSLGNLSSLTTLNIQGCKEAESLPDSLEHLNFLKDLHIGNTPISELRYGSWCMLKKIVLWSTKVSKISICGDCCPFLETLELYCNEDLRELETLPATLKSLYVYACKVLNDIRGVRGLKNLKSLFVRYCDKLDRLPCLAELTSLKKFELIQCHKLEKIEGLESLRSLETLKIEYCSELGGLPRLAELTSLKEFELIQCHKLEKIEGLESLRSLETLKIEDCPELEGLPNLAELTSLKKFELIKCHKLEKIEGLERLTSLEKLQVRGFLKASCRVSLEQCERLKSLVVVGNDVSVVESFISNIHSFISNKQKWPGEVMICTRAVIDAGLQKNFFTSFPLKNMVEFGSFGGLKLRRPESSVNANAILICFSIDYVYPKLLFQIRTDRGNLFQTELANGKWVWMGVFPQYSDWLQSNQFEIWASSEDKDVKVKEAWLVMGEEGSIREAFHQLSDREVTLKRGKFSGKSPSTLEASLLEDDHQHFDTDIRYWNDEKGIYWGRENAIADLNTTALGFRNLRLDEYHCLQDNNNHPLDMDENIPSKGRKHDNKENVKGEEERAKEKNKSPSKGRRWKGKLRCLFPGCIFFHSH